MRISRLYVDIALQAYSQIGLDDDASHYLRSVLRLKKNAELVLFNGSGAEFCCQLAEVSRKQVLVDVLTEQIPKVESPLTINFGLAISRSERMDFAIQKSVELGVSNITPLLTERCVVQIKMDKRQQKIRHWQKIAHHAAAQSGRTQVPVIATIMPLHDWREQQQGLRIFLDPQAQAVLASLHCEDNLVTLLSGPEGGFSDRERMLALEQGFQAIKLGPRILRTETAALAAIAALQTLWGDFNQTTI